MKSVLLYVLVLLKTQCSAETVVQTKPGRTATLKCTISDSSSDLKWLRDSELIHSTNLRTGIPLKGKGEIVKRSRLRNDKDLEISQVTPGDAGLFTCQVQKKEERHRLIVSSVSVSPSGPLDSGSSAVLHCHVAGLKDMSVLQWRGPSGQSQKKATVNLSPVTADDAGSWECVFTTGGETRNETLVLQVREPCPEPIPVSSTTASTKSLDHVYSTSSSHTLLEGHRWWVWAAIAGGCLVLLLWVLILVMYNLTRRKRRFIKKRKAMQMRPKQYCQCPHPTAVTSDCRTKPSAPAFSAPIRQVP